MSALAGVAVSAEATNDAAIEAPTKATTNSATRSTFDPARHETTARWRVNDSSCGWGKDIELTPVTDRTESLGTSV